MKWLIRIMNRSSKPSFINTSISTCKRASCILLILFLVTFLFGTVSAHPGKTDSDGGHYDHDTGEYHYHHGYPAHEHYDIDGDGIADCPYDFVDNTDDSPPNSSFTQESHSHTVSQVHTTAFRDKVFSLPPVFLMYIAYCIIASILGIAFFSVSYHHERSARWDKAKSFSKLSAIFVWTSFPLSLTVIACTAMVIEAFQFIKWIFYNRKK